MAFVRVFARSVFVASLSGACGGVPPPPPAELEPASAPAPAPPAPRREMAVRAELGTIDDDATEGTFRRLELELQQCHKRGLARVRFLGGDVEFFLRVGEDGAARILHLQHSTLGDRDTERCLMDLVAHAGWPRPRGGEAEVHKKMGFDPPPDARAPTAWSPDRVLVALKKQKKIAKDVAQCRRASKGSWLVTAYVVAAGRNGKILTAGMSPPSPEGDAIGECLLKAVMPLKLASPGRGPAKVSFLL